MVWLLLLVLCFLTNAAVPPRIKDSIPCVWDQLLKEARDIPFKVKSPSWKPPYLAWTQALVGTNITLATAKLWEVLFLDNHHRDLLFLTHESPFWDNFQQWPYDPIFLRLAPNPAMTPCEKFTKELTMSAFWIVNYDIGDKPREGRDPQFIIWRTPSATDDEGILQCDEFLDPEENGKRWGARTFLQSQENQLRVGQFFKMFHPYNQWRVEIFDQPVPPYSPKYPRRWVFFTQTFSQIWYEIAEEARGGPLPGST